MWKLVADAHESGSGFGASQMASCPLRASDMPKHTTSSALTTLARSGGKAARHGKAPRRMRPRQKGRARGSQGENGRGRTAHW